VRHQPRNNNNNNALLICCAMDIIMNVVAHSVEFLWLYVQVQQIFSHSGSFHKTAESTNCNN